VKQGSQKKRPPAMARSFATAALWDVALIVMFLVAWLADTADRRHDLSLCVAISLCFGISMALNMALAAAAPHAEPSTPFVRKMVTHLIHRKGRIIGRIIAVTLQVLAVALWPLFVIDEDIAIPGMVLLPAYLINLLTYLATRSTTRNYIDRKQLQALDPADPCRQVGPYLKTMRPHIRIAWTGVISIPFWLFIALTRLTTGVDYPDLPEFTSYGIQFLNLAGSIVVATLTTFVSPGRIRRLLVGTVIAQLLLPALQLGWVVGRFDSQWASASITLGSIYTVCGVLVLIYLTAQDWPDQQSIFVRRRRVKSKWNADPAGSRNRYPTH
jgi:ABC-type Mn2+/Zn2+ transport system permease subunit